MKLPFILRPYGTISPKDSARFSAASSSQLGYVPRNLGNRPGDEKNQVGPQAFNCWFHPLTGRLEKIPDAAQVNPARLVQVVRFGQCVMPDGFPRRRVLYRLQQIGEGLRLLGQILLGRAHFANYGKALEPKIKPQTERAAIQRTVPVHLQKRDQEGIHADHFTTRRPGTQTQKGTL